MPEVQTCSECGRPLADDAAEGFCPACMLEGALELGEVQSSKLKAQTAGKHFGDYELMNEIARGGMGVVYRARQISLDRIVAVKLILFGPYADETSVRRFNAEAAAAARLQHPNIVAIHEVGEEAGQHFFSMDCVEGRNLADDARERPWTAREAARLLKTIAQAIHYAHGEGIVHRDLKPSNILIDASGEPRITDFGLAKRLVGRRSTASVTSSEGKSDGVEPVPTDDLSITLTGQVLGSPSYVPPEQASGKRGQVGPRTDIYALGAILYYLLTGRPPFAAETITDTLQQVLNDDPVLPRLLNPSIPKDLETICLKCLEKEPAKRYLSAQELADELGRFLRSEPIQARPVSRPEKAWRWCRRQPALASALALVLVVAIGSPVAAFRINRERQQAEEARTRAEANEERATSEAAKSRQVATFLQDMLKGVGPAVALGRDTTMLREILDQTARRLDKDLTGQPEVEADLRATLGNVYSDLGEYTNAVAMHQEALRLRKKLHGDGHPGVAGSLHDLAWIFNQQGRYPEAEAAARQALALRKKLFGPEHPDVAASLSQVAEMLRQQFKFSEAEIMHREAVAMRRKLLGNEHPDLAYPLNLLGLLLWHEGKYSEAEAVHREAHAILKKVHGDQHPNLAAALRLIGFTLHDQGRHREAEAMYRESLAMVRKLFGDEHQEMAAALHHLATELRLQNKWAEAEAMDRKALAIRRKVLGNDHPQVAFSLDQLGNEATRQGKWAEAEVIFRECLAIRERKLPEDWLTYNMRTLVGTSLLEQSKYAEAEPLLLSGYEGMKQREDRIPARNRRLLMFPVQRLVKLYQATGQTRKADEWRNRLAQMEAP